MYSSTIPVKKCPDVTKIWGKNSIFGQFFHCRNGKGGVRFRLLAMFCSTTLGVPATANRMKKYPAVTEIL
jgi:hypothetical protein